MSSKPEAVVIARGERYWIMRGGDTVRTFPMDQRDAAFTYANHYRGKADPYVRAKCQGGWARKAHIDSGFFEAATPEKKES